MSFIVMSYLLVLKHRPPVNEGHPRHIVHRIIDLSVEGAVFEPALVEVADAEHEEHQSSSYHRLMYEKPGDRAASHRLLTRSLFLRSVGG